MARQDVTMCDATDFTTCAERYCCLGDDDLWITAAYLLIEAIVPGQNPVALLAASSTPVSFTLRDFLLGLVCIAANEADNTDGGIKVYAAAQKAGYNKLSPDQIRFLIAIGLCVAATRVDQ